MKIRSNLNPGRQPGFWIYLIKVEHIDVTIDETYIITVEENREAKNTFAVLQDLVKEEGL